MEIQKQKNLYLAKLLEQEVIKQDEFEDLVFKPEINAFHSNYLSSRFMDNINFGWSAWQAATAQAVPEGFVLVPKDKISCYWQDNDEPENFCNSSNDWDCLGDGIDKDQIMIVNKHTQANISTEKFYGAWKLIETSYGTRWKFELFKSESEAKQAMIEAQEQSHV